MLPMGHCSLFRNKCPLQSLSSNHISNTYQKQTDAFVQMALIKDLQSREQFKQVEWTKKCMAYLLWHFPWLQSIWPWSQWEYIFSMITVTYVACTFNVCAGARSVSCLLMQGRAIVAYGISHHFSYPGLRVTGDLRYSLRMALFHSCTYLSPDKSHFFLFFFFC